MSQKAAGFSNSGANGFYLRFMVENIVVTFFPTAIRLIPFANAIDSVTEHQFRTTEHMHVLTHSMYT